MEVRLPHALLFAAAAAAVVLFGCDRPTEPTPACAFTIAPATQTFSSDAGAASVMVTTSAASCAWTAASGASWITILEGAAGMGSGNVKYSVAANPSTNARAGALSIGGQSHSVVQQGLTPTGCSYAIAPASTSLPKEGGTGTIAVTAPTACPWTATSTAEWLVVTSGNGGAGNGTVAYSVDRNTGAATRSAALAIGDQAVVVTQAGETPCSYAIAPASASVGSEGGTGSVAVTAPAACTWTPTSSASWLVVTSRGPVVGNGTVSYAVDRNTAAATRTATIAIADQAFVVVQSGSMAACEYSVAPVQFSTCMPGGMLTTMIATAESCPWTATSNAPWLAVTAGETGSGPGSISLSFSANYDAPREGLVMVRWPSPTAGQNVRVSQAGCRYAVSKSAISVSATGGSGTFDVVQQSDPTECGGPLQDACVWTATSNVPWITITSSMPRAGDNPVFFTAAPNDGSAARTGAITVRDKIVQITQAGR